MNKKLTRLCVMTATDILITVGCGFLAMFARYAPDIANDTISDTLSGIPRLLISYISVFAVFGLYKVKWREMSAAVLLKQALACVVGFGISLIWDEALDLSLSRRYYLIIVFIFMLAAVCGCRTLMRFVRDITLKRKHEELRELRYENGSYMFCGGIQSGSVHDIVRQLDIAQITVVNGSEEVINECLATGCYVKKV